MTILNKNLLVAIVCLSISVPCAHADLIFDSGILPGSVENSNISDVKFSNYAGDNFTLASAAFINEIQWTGTYYIGGGFNFPPLVDDFTIAFHAFESGIPSSNASFSYHVANSVNRTNTGVLFLGVAQLFSFSASVPDTLLLPGDYLLSIYNDTSATPGAGFSWSFAARDGVYERRDLTAAWSPGFGGDHDFTIFGVTAVPEPSSIILLGMAALAATIPRRTRNKRK